MSQARYDVTVTSTSINYCDTSIWAVLVRVRVICGIKGIGGL